MTNQNPMPMTQDEFWEKYWFTPLQLVKVINPLAYDYEFLVENRPFIVEAGSKKRLPGNVANIYISNVSRIRAQEDDKFQFISDYALMKQYYDEIIVEIEDLSNGQGSIPAYLKQPKQAAGATGADENPPWDADAKAQNTIKPANNVGESSVELPSDPSFEYQSDKYKVIIDKNDKKMFYKNGKLTSEAEYSKAASLL